MRVATHGGEDELKQRSCKRRARSQLLSAKGGPRRDCGMCFALLSRRTAMPSSMYQVGLSEEGTKRGLESRSIAFCIWPLLN